MKQTYLIIGASSLVLLLVFIWVYLLIYGTPKPVENFFTDFSFGEDSENFADIPFIPPIENEQIDVASDVPLRQLTTRAVIGFGEKTENDQVTILYAEAGTGHVYSINLETGTEVRLSNITIQNPESAQFSPSGNLVAIRAGFGVQNRIELLTLGGENSSTKETLVPKMVDFTFNEENELLYTEYSVAGLLGRLINPNTKTTRTLFSVPFQNASVAWSTDDSTQHFIYPKPAAALTGFLYRIQNGTLFREPVSGGGLTAKINSDYYVHTITTDNGPVSFVTNRSNGERTSLPILTEPSKCVFSHNTKARIYCASENKRLTYEFPDNWHRGTVSFSDKIYQIDLGRGLATQLSNPEIESGRKVDVIEMKIGSTDRVLYFINKNDNTLWMYEI
jgi:hypothetical protein